MSGKTAIITGGSRGIGRAIALELARQGVNIAILYAGNFDAASEVIQEAQEFGVKAMAYKCNVADFEDSKKVVTSLSREFDSIDILVNNAGITKDTLMLRMSEADFDDVVDVNLKGTFNMIRHCFSTFVKQRHGRIINITSVSGLMGNAGQVNYAAAKAGVVGITKSVARELAGRNVTCNAIAPGFIETDMTATISQEHPLMKSIPLKRMGKSEEVAHLVAFLASDLASYITGEVIRIDGGLAM